MTYNKIKIQNTLLLLVLYSSFTYFLTYLIANFGETEFYDLGSHLLCFLYSAASAFSTYLSIRLIDKANKNYKAKTNQYLSIFLVAMLFFIVLSTIIFIAMRIIVGGKLFILSVVVNMYFSIFTYHLIVSSFYLAIKFFNEQNNLKLEKLNLQKKQVETDFKLLQQQLDPHFLFNNLNILSSFIHHNENVRANKFLEVFVDIYRYRLINKDKVLVKLEDEIIYLENYMHLISQRFKNSYLLSINIDVASNNLFIIPGTLQILLENVIKHNEASESKPINTEIFIEKRLLVVRNNLIPKKFKQHSTKTGLENLNSLYKLLSNEKIAIDCREAYYKVGIPLIFKN